MRFIPRNIHAFWVVFRCTILQNAVIPHTFRDPRGFCRQIKSFEKIAYGRRKNRLRLGKNRLRGFKNLKGGSILSFVQLVLGKVDSRRKLDFFSGVSTSLEGIELYNQSNNDKQNFCSTRADRAVRCVPPTTHPPFATGATIEIPPACRDKSGSFATPIRTELDAATLITGMSLSISRLGNGTREVQQHVHTQDKQVRTSGTPQPSCPRSPSTRMSAALVAIGGNVVPEEFYCIIGVARGTGT